MDETGRPTSVAILINDQAQWSLALRMGKAFAETGAAVILFSLGQASMPAADPIPEDSRLECYSCNDRNGMDYLPLREIAQKLKHCDLVIPI